MRMQRFLRVAISAAMLWLGSAAYSTAQIATATLLGIVRDETGAALPGAAVTIKSIATGATRTALSDTAGRYRIAAVDPGEYDVRVELANFKTVLRRHVLLTVGGATEADIEMSLGPIAETVTVAVETPLVEPAKTELSRVVNAQEIESLPISGRNFVDFVKLSSRRP